MDVKMVLNFITRLLDRRKIIITETEHFVIR